MPVGSRGGLLFLWHPNIFVHILGLNHNMLYVLVYADLPHTYFVLSIIYGLSSFHDKHNFWDTMEALTDSIA